ncbi:NfeD family protein [Clostridium thermobutyricum]|uniref:NfeD-like C-terminal domain-containing protein n=1 Tax=Clostridium thermobutyricum DSM 4928 TaxID=1121339 RepID=A0A1V4SRK2_9CLOT|nr:NfeD family protein [Clostridium thermobutyricum]OPX46518.1 hypothetical protein CLTHE_27390 [Clostridium thermobutyricum DSM 4928]
MIIWIIIGVIALAIDIFTSAFLFCWFAAGALAALICNLLGMSLGVQVLVFFIVSAVLAIICYPIVKRKIKESTIPFKTMEENYIGKTYFAKEEINKNSEGRIKISGIYWIGINTGEKINKGEEFIVTGIKGSKLEIKKK